jgi:hypothetical protein
VDITPVERTLAEPAPLRLLTRLPRLAHGDESAPQRRTIECVLLQDMQTGERRTLTLCHPELADPAEEMVSAPSPVGSALRGRWRAAGRPASRGGHRP